jgi:glycosyltransferase involved in cell wall biosynthesis
MAEPRAERTLGRSMRIAIVYDCLFPNTVGGAERWYRNLAERLEQRHSVAYVTRRQWGDEGPQTTFRTLAVAPGGELYTESGRRRIWPPLRFGVGVFIHLLRNGRRYDAVQCASFPYFSLLAAGLALRLSRSRARLIVDWHEVWGRDYWRSYLGPLKGRIGFAIQGLCIRLPDQSFTFSRLVENRLRELGHRAPITRLTGEFAADDDARARISGTKRDGPPLVVTAGRQIPEKRVRAVPGAIAAALEAIPELRCVILGDGPDAGLIKARTLELGLGEVVELRGRVTPEEVSRMIAAASCLLHTSEREGYGLVVVEAASLGTPSVVVAGPENAATELIDGGVNGFVVASATADELGGAIVKAVRAGPGLRQSTLDWYERHRDQLSIESSLARVEASYSPGDEGG